MIFVYGNGPYDEQNTSSGITLNSTVILNFDHYCSYT